MTDIKKDGLKLFVITVILLSLICDVIIYLTNNGIFYLVLMWIPALAAIVAVFYERIRFKSIGDIKEIFNCLGFKICNIKYILIGVLVPLIYLLIPYIIYWIMYPSDFAYNGVSIILILKDCLPVMIFGTIFGLISALGEEIGWRGYFVPTLNKYYGEKKALIYSSLFWCLWHLPLIIFGLYLSDISIFYQVPMFILCIFPIGLICGILSLKTKSVWPSAFLHAAHNNYDQGVFQLITRGSNMFYLVSETGIFTVIIVWCIVFVGYLIERKRKA